MLSLSSLFQTPALLSQWCWVVLHVVLAGSWLHMAPSGFARHERSLLLAHTAVCASKHSPASLSAAVLSCASAKLPSVERGAKLGAFPRCWGE